ncbi:hypothetical protein A8926_3080 [Saccharopolyspora spinosa]|uniref:Uncharacterized protein n=1 Tax=Saccharopolyspora spinosa TaxID=60894 RepID=A0A2N3XVH8_SACSN|nr:hypothetical protein A8926_2289 [Saccharopolyspora spinosa]PKW15381.1 hypothetical protein A8926_3080 [Saccharopolyspora spinosa]
MRPVGGWRICRQPAATDRCRAGGHDIWISSVDRHRAVSGVMRYVYAVR